MAKPAKKPAKQTPKKSLLSRRKCGAMVNYYHQLENTPGYRQILGKLESETRSRTLSRTATDRDAPLTVPVVVHVVYRTVAEKISMAQIKSQIEVLNKDFNATNPDIAGTPSVWKNIVGNARITFALAKTSPKGSATGGVIYKKTSKTGFRQIDDGVKRKAAGGSDAWPSDRYLNIWVCTLGDDLLGYAQFPGGNPDTDGVVILNSAFGTTGTAVSPFNLGRTTTHEIGHWCNLRHIWGDTEDCTGTDHIDDTPNQQFPNRDKPLFPKPSCGNGPNGDMFMNYMDYVDDAAMFMFTKGQVTRMHVAIDALRPGLREHGVALTS
jgi:Pregnancy-associated plasma protein-A